MGPTTPAENGQRRRGIRQGTLKVAWPLVFFFLHTIIVTNDETQTIDNRICKKVNFLNEVA